jgi:TetR/AcrR family transcriptional regulator
MRSAAKKSIEPSSARAERTRAAILAAAEDLFARHGYASTRLEDVADTVLMTRAALFYYFRDKQFLFDAVLSYSFGELGEKLEKILAARRGSVTARLEKAMAAWLDAIIERPARARLILRLVADNTETLSHGIFSDNNQIAAKFWALFEQGRQSGELKPLHNDIFHIASAVIGTAVFYVAALSVLLPEGGGFKPLAPEHAASHKQEALLQMRLLLGIKPESG